LESPKSTLTGDSVMDLNGQTRNLNPHKTCWKRQQSVVT